MVDVQGGVIRCHKCADHACVAVAGCHDEGRVALGIRVSHTDALCCEEKARTPRVAALAGLDQGRVAIHVLPVDVDAAGHSTQQAAQDTAVALKAGKGEGRVAVQIRHVQRVVGVTGPGHGPGSQQLRDEELRAMGVAEAGGSVEWRPPRRALCVKPSPLALHQNPHHGCVALHASPVECGLPDAVGAAGVHFQPTHAARTSNQHAGHDVCVAPLTRHRERLLLLGEGGAGLSLGLAGGFRFAIGGVCMAVPRKGMLRQQARHVLLWHVTTAVWLQACDAGSGGSRAAANVERGTRESDSLAALGRRLK